MSFDPAAYASMVRPLVEGDRLNDLGPGREALDQRDTLRSLSAAKLTDDTVVDGEMAQACLAGLWLLHDFLDESHRISQDLPSATGSFWHGIMHRREPDPGNSKYWFRRVGRHPVFPGLVTAVQDYLGTVGSVPAAASFLQQQTEWDPFRFIDLCENARRQEPDLVEICQQAQRLEWELLFDYCYRSARGETAQGAGE